jgi:bifunctional UDP-N-acetylglucosamine pyrophosphorylase/glucosamine-1-phosphate N-acetyltransferase
MSNADSTASALYAIVLAAGQGTRMRSGRAKVLHKILGRTMVDCSLSLLAPLGVVQTALVLGHQAAAVEAAVRSSGLTVPGLRIAIQTEQRGTSDAVRSALPVLPELAQLGGRVLILYGDTPLLTVEKLRELLQRSTGKLGMISTTLADPHGYGRLIREGGLATRIVEHKDCTPEQLAVREVNAGIYVVDAAFLVHALGQVGDGNAQHEFYLTDLVSLAVRAGEQVTVIDAPAAEVMGVNDRADLAVAESIARARIAKAHMLAGVTLHEPATTSIDFSVEIARDVEIFGGVSLRGKTRIGEGCTIDQGCVLSDVSVDSGVHIKPYTVAASSQIGPRCQVGPFSHLRPDSHLHEDAHVGNFVEIKKTELGRGSKANHLAYLGDSSIGAGVNIGCGTITCNYDGFAKHQTIIEDGVFIGSDTQLVAPVRIGRNAIVGAGTTVTRDVPADALSVSRVPQENMLEMADKLRTRFAARKARK